MMHFWIWVIFEIRSFLLSHFHTLTFTLWLSHFDFHTFTFTLLHFTFTLSHFHTFTFTLSLSHFHTVHRTVVYFTGKLSPDGYYYYIYHWLHLLQEHRFAVLKICNKQSPILASSPSHIKKWANFLRWNLVGWTVKFQVYFRAKYAKIEKSIKLVYKVSKSR